MASKINKKPARSPAAQHKTQKSNNATPDAAKNATTLAGGIGAYIRELQSINQTLRNSLDQFSRLYEDLESPLHATEIATLFLDRELRIRDYTPSMQALFSIGPDDIGQPIQQLQHTLRYTRFLEDAENVLRTLAPIEHEVQAEAGSWFLIHMHPYPKADHESDGLIFTMIDITQLKATQMKLAELKETSTQQLHELTQTLEEMQDQTAKTRDLFYTLFDTNLIPTVLIRQEDEVFLYANVEFLDYFQLAADEVIGHNAAEFSFGLGLREKMANELRSELQKTGRVRDVEFEIRLASGKTRVILASLQALVLEKTNALITTFIDITERVQAEQKIRSLAAELTGTEQAERHKLSQVLHDDLQQRLFAVQMHMSFLRDAYEKNDLHAFQADFPQLEEWLADAIKVTRQLSVDLSPPIVQGEGLPEAVIWLAAQMNEQYGLKVDIKVNGTLAEIEEKVRVLVFYAIRELLFNTVKHAGTSQAAVRFEHDDARMLVIVKDQGTGFNSTRVMNDPKLSHGLLVIHDRLSLLGCRMEVNSNPGNGTEVNIEIPYHGTEP